MIEKIRITCRAADSLPIDSIIEFQGKLKKITKTNMEKLKKSILKNGFTAPIFVWQDAGDNKILDGHQRLATLIKMRQQGFDIPLLPVAYIEADDETEARRKLLAITSQYGEFDALELAGWLEELDDDIKDTLRFVDEEMIIDTSVPIETVGDDEINEDVPAITQLGDLWELGEHRLLCGDSTDSEAVSILMNGQKADQWLTDPPYNVDYKGKTKEALTIKNDHMNSSTFRDFLKNVFIIATSEMKQGAVFYIWHSDMESYNFRGACIDSELTVRQTLIWVKNYMVMSRKDFHWRHESCLYGWKDGATHLWASNRKQTTILEYDRPSRSEDHPTMKPVPLFLYCINNNTKELDIILDTFLGSGSTLIACEKTNRICYGMELDPHYCDVIVNRYKTWCETNGKIPIIKLNGEDYEL